MSHVIRAENGSGLIQVVRSGDCGLKFISFDLLRLEPGMKYSEDAGDCEVCAVFLEGSAGVEAGGMKWNEIGTRENVFDGPASALYVPSGEFSIEAPDGNKTSEIALLRCKGNTAGAPVFISPENVKITERGKDNWKRYVHDIIDRDFPARRMLVGETFSPAGNWSSSPPHRHDENNPPHEADLEEIYFFKCNPRQGFQVIRMYTDDYSLNETYTVEQNDTAIITRGYHPVAAAAGYEGYYLWLLAGETREAAVFDDPRHAWLKKP